MKVPEACLICGGRRAVVPHQVAHERGLGHVLLAEDEVAKEVHGPPQRPWDGSRPEEAREEPRGPELDAPGPEEHPRRGDGLERDPLHLELHGGALKVPGRGPGQGGRVACDTMV